MSSSTYDVELVGEYKPGSIRNIKLKNFLTYADVEFSPGPRLNMVIGPNGTGKSSILCAICLALGGDPKLLGRAEDARTFIMNDKKEALLEVTLTPFPNQPVHSITRVIDRDKGSEKGRGRGASVYYINGEKVSVNDVKELVKQTYHISIDNLCTFLPQDKVGEFSRFDDKSLLIETEKTLSGTQHLYHSHKKLIEAEKDLLSGNSNVANIESRLNQLKVENARLEREKERMEERQAALQQTDLLEKKIIWLQFERKRGEAIELKNRKSEIKQRLKAAQQALLPFEERLETIKEQKQTITEKYKSLEKNVLKQRKEMEKQTKKFENHDDQIDSILLELREIDSKKSKNIAIYNKAKERVELLEGELEAFPTQEQVEKEFQDAVQERRKALHNYQTAQANLQQHQNKLRDLQDDATNFQNKLAKMIDEKARRRDRIFRQQPNLAKIYSWLEQGNRNMFRRPIWGPVVCEISTKSQNAAAFLEQHVPNSTLKAFVVECKEDYDKLYKEVREKLKTPINILLIRDGKLEPTKRIYSESKYNTLKSEHGIIGYLDDSFTAPDPIMQALKISASVDKVLVGGEITKQSLDKKGLLNYLTEPDRDINQNGNQSSCIICSEGPRSMKYTTTISRYGEKKPSTREDNIEPAKWLAQGINPRHKAELEAKLKGVHEKMNEYRPIIEEASREFAELEQYGQEINAKAKSAKEAKAELAKFLNKLATARRKMKEAQENVENSNDEEEKKKLIQSLMNRISHSINAIEQHSECQKQMMNATFASAGIRVNKDVLVFAERTIQREFSDKKQVFEETEKESRIIISEYEQARDELKLLKNSAERLAPLHDNDGNELPLKLELEQIPVDSLEEAEATLEEARAKVNSIIANPHVIEQYEAKQAEIERMQEQLDEEKGSKESKLLEIEQMKNPWEQQLEKSVEKISTLFSRYMAELDYAGEVTLKKGGSDNNPNSLGNFKDWGIEIRVAFRKDSKTQVLTAHVQSGGERSVSTIMYLMALQEMMVSPFRCVDEINQGLDDRNERFVFRRIVQNSTRPPIGGDLCNHSGQYFLITPKLLPNLYDMEAEAMTILFVMNGPYNFQSPSDWNVDHLCSLRNKRSNPSFDENDENDPMHNDSNNLEIPTSSPAQSARKKRRKSTKSRGA